MKQRREKGMSDHTAYYKIVDPETLAKKEAEGDN